MSKAIGSEEFLRRFNKMYGNELSVDIKTYCGMHHKCRFIDPKYGEWLATPQNMLIQKRKHMQRYIKENSIPKISIEEVKKRIVLIWGDLVKIDAPSYNGICKTCKFVDKDFGIFFTSPNHVFKGHGHKTRGNQKRIEDSRLSINEVKNRIQQAHGNQISIKDETYISLYRPAVFIDIDHGEWTAIPNNVIKHKSGHPLNSKNKAAKTSLNKYGTIYPNQNKMVYDKIQRGRWDTITLFHWKTNLPIVCRASYEFAIVSVLNKEKIDFDWQIPFDLNANMVYFCDLYLKEEDKYIEIKGYFQNERNKKKWELFHKIMPNSELWMEKEVCKFTGQDKWTLIKKFKEAKENDGKNQKTV